MSSPPPRTRRCAVWRGGVILTNDEELAKKFNKAIFPGTQGGPLEHVIAAKAVCFGEALCRSSRLNQQRVVTNDMACSRTYSKQGFSDLARRRHDNHLMLIDLRKTGVTGKERSAVWTRYTSLPTRMPS